MIVDTFDKISGRYDLLNDILSLGRHRRWKKRLVQELIGRSSLKDGERVLDVSSGTGDVAFLLSKATKNLKVFALDPSFSMVQISQKRHGNLYERMIGFSESLPFRDSSMNSILCSFGVRNFQDREKAFLEWHRVLSPKGVAGILEIHPVPKVWYRIFLGFFWNHAMPFLGKVFGLGDAYRYLRDSSQKFPPSHDLVRELEKVGFAHIKTQSLFGKGMVSLNLFQKKNV